MVMLASAATASARAGPARPAPLIGYCSSLRASSSALIAEISASTASASALQRRPCYRVVLARSAPLAFSAWQHTPACFELHASPALGSDEDKCGSAPRVIRLVIAIAVARRRDSAAGGMGTMPHDKVKAAARKRMAMTGEARTEARRKVIAEEQARASLLLLPEPALVREGPLGWAEPSVNFLLESTRPIAATGRANVNEWYSRFPDHDRGFGTRLTSRKGTDHEVALDELLLHERLAQNARVSYEEDRQGPDFRLYRDEKYLGAIEVMSLYMERGWSDEQARHSRIADQLNSRLSLDRWFISFEVAQLDREPSARGLASWVSGIIDQLPDPGMSDTRTHHETYTANRVRLRFMFSPCKPDPTGTRGRIVGPGPVIGGFVKSAERLRIALQKKAGGRYELRDSPFAVCVGVHDPFCSLDQIEAALYGNVQYEVATMARSRAENGFFGRGPECPEGKNTRISCVFAMSNWHPWQPEKARVIRLDNPFAAQPFPEGLLAVDAQVTRVDHGNGRISFEWLPSRPADTW